MKDFLTKVREFNSAAQECESTASDEYISWQREVRGINVLWYVQRGTCSS